MNKATKMAIMGLAFVLPSLCLASFETNLKFGDQGPEVSALQQFLKDAGFFTADITGNFYGITKQAVKDFQKAHGLPNTGYFGPMSRATINASDAQQASIAPIVEMPAMAMQPVASSTSPEKQMIQEEQRVETVTPAPVTIEQCRSDGSSIWDEVTFSDPRANAFVWFGNSKELNSFVVSRTDDQNTVIVSIPSKIRNDSQLSENFQVFYSNADGKQLQNTESVTSSTTPITITLSDEYMGHKVAFQLLFSYPCLKQYTGWDYMKASNNSFQYVQL